MIASSDRPADGAAGRRGHSATSGVTMIMVLVMGLSFLFGFGNSWTLGIQLGVPPYVAPLVAPAVDLSVIGLLIGIHQLALGGASARQMGPALRLLVFAGFVTLALNVAEPLIERNYGRAAFDAVGPLLLIGWAEVGPGLVQTMKAIETATVQPTSTNRPPAANEASGQPGDLGPTAPVPAVPHTRQPDDGANPLQSVQPAGPNSTPSGSLADDAASDLEQGTPASSSPTTEVGEGKTGQCRGRSNAREQDLLHRARAEDVLHWQQHQRPISAETLRKRLHVGAPTARKLVAQLRSDTHTQIEGARD